MPGEGRISHIEDTSIQRSSIRKHKGINPQVKGRTGPNHPNPGGNASHQIPNQRYHHPQTGKCKCGRTNVKMDRTRGRAMIC